MPRLIVSELDLRGHGLSGGDVRRGVPPHTVVPWQLPPATGRMLAPLLEANGFDLAQPIRVEPIAEPHGFLLSQ